MTNARSLALIGPLTKTMSISPRDAIRVLSSARRASWLFGLIGMLCCFAYSCLMNETVAPVSRVMWKGSLLLKSVRIWLGSGVRRLSVGDGSCLLVKGSVSQ